MTLLPCPFCGSEDIEIETDEHPSSGWSAIVKCKTCKSQGPDAKFFQDTERDAQVAWGEVWNNRTVTDESRGFEAELTG